MMPLLENHNRDRFEIYCYVNVARPDNYTAQLKRSTDHWRDIYRVPDREAARRIRRDGIDVLVDRTGHFAGTRLPLFAYRVAPVQVALPGYPTTTGLPSMDYRLTDAIADPPGTSEHLYSERLVRLPGSFACYGPSLQSPDPPPAPVNALGYVTFGSFNNRSKLTRRMLELWVRIPSAVPDSRLLFHHAFNGRPRVTREFRDPVAQLFRAQGIDPSRLEFLGCLPFEGHLFAFRQIDVMLDTFPYSGMTTTCESLWMGVPVITLTGASHVSRVSTSFLTALGATEWVAATPDEYVEIAVRVARDVSKLCHLRASLRERMRLSPLASPHAYTNALEHEYLAMVGKSEARRIHS